MTRPTFWLNFTAAVSKTKETEETFVDELQILAQKVISKKPDFCVDLDAMLKQCYASQLYDRINASIVKMLLIQMPQMTFTQFRNELARVLGTHQRSRAKTSTKTVMTSLVEVEQSKQQEQTKSQSKKKEKISAQSSQIKDLCTKLDQAVAENTQIKEFLSPTALQQAFMTTL